MTFDFLAVDRYVPLVSEGQDCAIRVGQLVDSSLVARKLAYNERIICCAPDFLARFGPFDTVEALMAASWVSLPWQKRFEVKDSRGRRRNVTASSNVLVSNSDILTDAAVQGLGLAIKSRLAVQAELDSGALVEVATNTLWEPSAPIWFVFSPESRAGQKTKLFGDWAVEAFATKLNKPS